MFGETKYIKTFALATALSIAATAGLTKEVRIAMGASGDGALQKAQRLFAAKIEESTGGEYTGRTFEGTLLNYAELPQGVATGVVDVGYWPAAYVPGEFPVTNYASNIVATIVEPVAVGGALSEFIFNCDSCIEEFRRKNQVNTGFAVVAPYIFMTKEKVNDVSDLKGMRVRGFSAFNKLVGQWGGVAVAVPVGEVYQALATGHLEANIHLWDIIDTYSLGDNVDYVYDAPIGIYGGNSMFNINRDFWMTLSDQNKRHFFNAAADSLAYATVMYEANNRNLIASASELGVELLETPASIRDSINSFRDNNVKEVIAAAASDEKIPDSAELGATLLALIDKWRGLAAGIDQTDPDAVAALYRKELFDNINLKTLE
ncbi:hypothetical protein OAJ10_05765 [Paracoccaceae bacterium]|nr:hypothetical protein [Paracoccaceae bacterium]